MMTLEELRKRRDIVREIDWDMTPEEAVVRYLEWGNNWSRGRSMVRSRNDVAYYFVVNTWDEPARIYLVERNSDAARELAAVDMPEALRDSFRKKAPIRKGVYAIDREIREWLEKKL